MKAFTQPGYFDIEDKNGHKNITSTLPVGAILDSLPSRMAVLDSAGVIQQVNHAWRSFENEKSFDELSEKAFIGLNYPDLFSSDNGYSPEDRSEGVNGMLAVLKGDISCFTMEYSWDNASSHRWFSMRISSIPSSTDVLVSHSDITDRKELEQMKDEFIGIASHELKTPITSLKGIVHILKLSFKKQMKGEGGKLLSTMDAQLNKLTKIMGDLLVLNTTPGNKILLHLEKFDFKKLVNETVQNVKNLSPLHFLLVKENESVSLTADRSKLEQVITNLLTNAVKYSPQSNQVIIRSRVEGNKILFSVQDFGIGIDKENVDKVFERFYRVKTKKTFGGFGLGLFICAEIIKAHRGKIWVESEAGKGSVFHFSLPITQE